MQTVQISEIVVGNNPRKFFDPAEMEAPTASIREKGSSSRFRSSLAGRRVPGCRWWSRYAAVKAAHGDDYPMPVVIKDLTTMKPKNWRSSKTFSGRTCRQRGS